METVKMNDATSKVIDALIEQVLNNPGFSWEKMWKNMGTGNSPYNPITKTVYSGMNAFILGFYSAIKGNNQFATFNQISGKNGSINKGSKGIPIFLMTEFYIDDMGKKYYKKSDIPNGISFTTKKVFKTYTVFSISDSTLTFEKPETIIKNNPIEICEKIVKNWECKINIGLDNSRAFYQPSNDYINMPDLQAFKNSNAFYAVAFHEIAHSTGAKNRLNRDLSGMFGNDKYAKEELIAELSSVLLSANFNILTPELVKNSTAYLQSWTKKMIDKKDELYSGLNHAMKAYNYILKVVN
jgi:antirestriction protein ArdC